MAEDYTYTTVTDWRKRAHELARDVNELTRRVQELERELADMRDERAEAIVLMMKFQQERDELRAKLDAVPVDAIRYMLDPFANGGTSWAESEAHMNTLTAWVKAQGVQA